MGDIKTQVVDAWQNYTVAGTLYKNRESIKNGAKALYNNIGVAITNNTPLLRMGAFGEKFSTAYKNAMKCQFETGVIANLTDYKADCPKVPYEKLIK